MATEKIVLGDGQEAFTIGGKFVRVDVVERKQKQNGEWLDEIIQARAYEVDASGARTGVQGPIVGQTIHGKAVTLNGALLAAQEEKALIVAARAMSKL